MVKRIFKEFVLSDIISLVIISAKLGTFFNELSYYIIINFISFH